MTKEIRIFVYSVLGALGWLSWLIILTTLNSLIHMELYILPNQYTIPDNDITVSRVFTEREFKLEFKNVNDAGASSIENLILWHRDSNNIASRIFIKAADSVFIDPIIHDVPNLAIMIDFEIDTIIESIQNNCLEPIKYRLPERGYYYIVVNSEYTGFKICSPDGDVLFKNYFGIDLYD